MGDTKQPQNPAKKLGQRFGKDVLLQDVDQAKLLEWLWLRSSLSPDLSGFARYCDSLSGVSPAWAELRGSRTLGQGELDALTHCAGLQVLAKGQSVLS